MKSLQLLCSICALLAFSISLSARPEYALKHRQNKCSSCHFSPAGGGMRTQAGKLYGNRNFRPSKFSGNKYFSADFKALFISPEKPESNPGGGGVMAGNVGMHIPLESGVVEKHLIINHNLSGYSATAARRQAYFRFKYFDEPDQGLVQYLMIGRIITPFGLMTDEHRTYTKLQTRNAWNTDLDNGFMVSGELFEPLHYDFALLNGFRSGGGTPVNGQATLWSQLLNLRWTPHRIPIILGASLGNFSASTGAEKSQAFAGYGMISLERLTGGYFRGSLLVEYARGSNMNSQLSNSYFSSATKTNFANNDSTGIYGLINFDLTEKFTVQYKYDELLLDKDFTGSYFKRHGIGIKYFMGANLYLLGRYETGEVNNIATETDMMLDMDAAWLVLQGSI